MQARSQLLPLLRSPFQGDLLAWLYLHPDQEYSLSDLARRFGVSQSTVSRETARLAEVDLVVERRYGNMRMVQANPETRLADPLTRLLAVTYGPSAILGELLTSVAGIEAAYIYGSWAARYSGEPGDVPRDVDVLVVGDADEDELYAVARDAERRLGREVNVSQIAPARWHTNADDPFLTSLRSRPLVPLELSGEA